MVWACRHAAREFIGVTMARARVIAHYLPQFHPIPENDEWWGPGFTEWVNVARARPLFRGHDQPKLPGELGFYDLRLAETRAAQAELARGHGIEAFCYWHYWFAGRRVLDRPFREVLATRQPDFPFCLGWANQSWTGHWHGAPGQMLIEQTYPGPHDFQAHFDAVLPALEDARYLRVDGRPLFLIFRPLEMPSASFLDVWREAAARAGLPGIYVVAVSHDPAWDPRCAGFDAAALWRSGLFTARVRRPVARFRRVAQRSALVARLDERLRTSLLRRPIHVYSYDDVAATMVTAPMDGVPLLPTVYPNWDNTPRAGGHGSVVTGSTPDKFATVLVRAVSAVQHLPPEERLVFIRSWNEWAEGNFIEPDRVYGRGWLEACRRAVIA
jgi:lipopolysaccharide biosynthesis protein